jgi:L-lactate permease
MSGLDSLEDFAGGVATASSLFLSWFLFGPELTIIFAGIIALGIVLNRTPSHKRKPGRSRKTQPLSPCSHSRLASAVATANMSPAYTRRDVIVIPDSPVSFKLPKKKRSKHLAAVQRSLSFEGAL